jgi:hypothetical protein
LRNFMVTLRKPTFCGITAAPRTSTAKEGETCGNFSQNYQSKHQLVTNMYSYGILPNIPSRRVDSACRVVGTNTFT